MSYKIEFSARAARDFKKLAKTNKAMVIKIKDAIAELAEEPRPRGVETLTGTNPSLQRIRVGDFRVIYEIKEGELLVWVVRLGDRKEIYRFLK
ncbi:MAG: type II toxin-antitoxin system RelE/ParE family toxin [Desulfuromonadales bacterium]